jgi:MFS-type transporter involved in bile tolerance (Atg22 family)
MVYLDVIGNDLIHISVVKTNMYKQKSKIQWNADENFVKFTSLLLIHVYVNLYGMFGIFIYKWLLHIWGNKNIFMTIITYVTYVCVYIKISTLEYVFGLRVRVVRAWHSQLQGLSPPVGVGWSLAKSDEVGGFF